MTTASKTQTKQNKAQLGAAARAPGSAAARGAQSGTKLSASGQTTFNVQTFNMGQPALIEASAGTGKTYSITNLVLRALLGVGTRETSLARPLEVEELLIVTFTNAATADLRLRIYERIRSARLALEEFISVALNQVVEQLKHPEAQTALKASSARIVAAKAQRQDVGTVLLKKEELGGAYEELTAQERAEFAQRLQQLEADDEHELFLANNYSEEELNGIFVGVDLDYLLNERCQLQDDNTKFIIKELVERSRGHKDSPLRRAVDHLIRAERNINNAAICTIHSFCNSTLTQIYALEAGEAFNTELKLDLSAEIHEAYYSVWRRLFYQKQSSPLLLSRLGTSDPMAMVGPIHLLNGVRLSGDELGFYGYQLKGMDELLARCQCQLKRKEPLEPQLMAYITQLTHQLNPIEAGMVEIATAVLATLPYEELRRWINPKSGQLRQLSAEPNKIALKDKCDLFLVQIAQCYELLTQARQLGPQSGAWADLVQLLDHIAQSAPGCLGAKGSLFNARLKAHNDVERECQAQIDQLVTALSSKLTEFMGQDNNDDLLHQSTQLIRVLTAIVMNQEFERMCHEQHLMSTDDILRRLDYALNLRGTAGTSLARAIRAKYPLAMIDEFQDTDPIQFSIFSSIYLNHEALKQQAYCYLIGDPKQSIYAFRGSDINSYLKARDLIVDLTHGHGIYTLDTNYRSSPDVVAAANAIFGSTLNHNNVNPFNESRITFEAVKSGKAKGLLAQARHAGQARIVPTGSASAYGEGAQIDPAQDKDITVKERAFYFDGVEELFYQAEMQVPLNHAVISQYPLDQYAQPESGTSAESEILAFKGPANTYVVHVGNLVDQTKKDDLNWAYARASAKLIERLLTSGRIVDGGKERPVVPGDIAVIVRRAAESDLIQNELWNLQIPSVYLSDQTSVLGSLEAPSTESIELGYLMEAMCDCTNRKKVFRVLGSRLLCLTAQEYQEHCATDNFEREVKLLLSCAQTWQRFGFMPAFMQWAHDPRHNICQRLLALKDGERWYTNYCHIGEIIQSVHSQKSGIQSQLNWYYDLIHHNQNIFDADVTKKRLESEQDQIRIITIHKSKGLEFPIVFMPFLWMTASVGNNRSLSPESYLGVTRYYDPSEQKVVLDVAAERQFEVQERLPVYHSSTQSYESGHFQAVQVSVNPKTIITTEARREDMRLLYVALTRARLANFIMVGSFKHRTSPMGALVEIQGRERQGYAVDVDADGAITNLETNEGLQDGAARFVAAALAHPECFTVLDGQSLLEPDELSAAPESTGVITIYPNMSTFREGQAIPPLAQSFVYRGAIDHTFNIFSYSSLVAGQQYTPDLQHSGATDNTMYGEDEVNDEPLIDEFAAPVSEQLAFQMATKPQEPQFPATPDTSVSALMQRVWQGQQFYYARNLLPQGTKACFEFPCGTGPGKFMHEVLEHVEFGQVKEQGCFAVIFDGALPESFKYLHNQRYQRFLRESKGGDDKMPLALWFNDVLEAPIVAGRYHCFALADLQLHHYEREMDFLMSNHSFNTDKLNELCAQVADQLLPDELKDKFRGTLQLKSDELVGYITGSIDLACCLNLNARLTLRQRPDLLNTIAPQQAQALSTAIATLKDEVAQGLHPELQADPELSLEELGQDDANEKYYVIDYKSNYLGSSYKHYQGKRLIEAVYEHRYDVQFLIYSLALYRFLKRRLGVPFDESYEKLRAFYDQHIGGVIYLFLRGMRANYLRDSISSGVFATRLDFDVIYQLDQMFSPDHKEGQ